MRSQQRIVVIGGGAAGLNVAGRLRRLAPALSVTLVEPADYHYYQPLWTLVGGGVYPRERSQRLMQEVVPPGVAWIKSAVHEFLPAENLVVTQSGERLGYDALVVAPGIQINWQAIPGLKEGLGRHGICSNYSFDSVNSTWAQLQALRGGNALFTIPSTPIKCAGAPLKIMFLAEDHFRLTGIRAQCQVRYLNGGAAIFRAPHYAKALVKIAAARDIEVQYKRELIALRPESREAVFRDLDQGDEHLEKYDFIHVTPPMGALEVMKRSPLADSSGWVDVDKSSLRHVRYDNIFSLGDASSLPTSKTAAAIRAQGPVLVANLLAVLAGRTPVASYNGYTSCPLITGYGRLMLAEFDYELQPCETFPFDQAQERRSMYWLKKYVMPFIYWRGLVRGRRWPTPWPIAD